MLIHHFNQYTTKKLPSEVRKALLDIKTMDIERLTKEAKSPKQRLSSLIGTIPNNEDEYYDEDEFERKWDRSRRVCN